MFKLAQALILPFLFLAFSTYYFFDLGHTKTYDEKKGTVIYQSVLKKSKPMVLQGPSPLAPFCCVFEDDGQTGYFYACSNQKKDAKNPILDALHIYDGLLSGVNNVRIEWSKDGLKAALLINNNCQAVFDFDSFRGYCRSGFPLPSRNSLFGKYSHEWSDECLSFFTL